MGVSNNIREKVAEGVLKRFEEDWWKMIRRRLIEIETVAGGTSAACAKARDSREKTGSQNVYDPDETQGRCWK